MASTSRLGARARQALGLATAAGLLVRHARLSVAPRPLAERLADLPLRDLPVEHPVTIRWNRHHVPFIEAENDTDLATALGMVHMHLRATQIEVLRRISAGRVAEMAGPAAVDIDQGLRTLGIADVVPGIIAMLPERSRAWVEAFLRGFNAHAAHARPAPEFAVLGIVHEPWTLTDFFTLARLFSADLSWPVLRRLLSLRDGVDAATWRALWPRILRGGAPDVPPEDAGATGLIEAATRAGAGSNAAAIDGRRTPDGAGIVSGDPHLSIALPNPWLVCALHSPNINAAGLMLPGVPFIALGRNRAIAWGGTSLHAASTDFVDLSGVPQSAYTTREETVRVRGGRARKVVLRTTPWGPVVSDAALFPSGTPLALKWVGHTPSDELSAMLGLLTARDAEDFRRTLRGFAVPGQTMVYAGPDGIGRQNAAHLPARDAGDPPDLIVSRAQAEREWATLVTGDRLFGEWNPQAGFIASANERLVGPPPARTPIGYFFAAEERVSRIRALLAPARGTQDRHSMAALFRDVRQPNALVVRDVLLAHLPGAPLPGHGGLVGALRDWDGAYDAANRGALAFELLLGETAHLLLGRTVLGHLETVWTTRALVADELARAAGPRLRTALGRALPIAARRFRRFGSWGAVHRHRPQHPFGALPGALGRIYRTPAFPGTGGNDTLDKTGHALVRGRHTIRFGATARYVFDLADPDRNEVVLFGGQDGWLGSETFADQLALWRRGEAMALPLRPETARASFPHVTVLRPD